ncbi:MAG: hypothetical protein SAK29_31735 [Scytonema sp. PMC 1069.18]|nr:hypothetical protein [Scytonema sp. PMC 1069.18]MEC4885435.1 hypothetical protein [Scytonema sp. PMC 1070.18]
MMIRGRSHLMNNSSGNRETRYLQDTGFLILATPTQYWIANNIELPQRQKKKFLAH